MSALELRRYGTVDSTNDVALAEGRAAYAERGQAALCVVADRQARGRGRAGRAWASPAGHGLYLSCWFRLEWPPARAALLTLAAGVAVREALAGATGALPLLKWPNDLLAPDASGRKLGGILTETRSEGGRIADAVIGVGVNLRTPGGGWDADAAAHPAALDEFARTVPDAGALARPVAEALAGAVERLAANGADGVVARARDAMPLWGRRVRAQEGPRVIEGVAHDLAEDGGLVVRLDSGAGAVVHAGDVRVDWGTE